MSDEQLVNDAIKKLRIVMSSAQFRHVESFTFVSKTNTKISQNYSKKFVVFFFLVIFISKYTKAITGFNIFI